MERGRILCAAWGIAPLIVAALPTVASAAATLKTLATFTNATGVEPEGALVLDSSGNLYGTTSQLGSTGSNTYGGDGTVFELPAGSSNIQPLVTFTDSNGSMPVSNLLLRSGNLYGTTRSGGTMGGGTVFQLPLGSTTLSTIANFGGATGGNLNSGLTADANGNLYGTNSNSPNGGTVFKIASNGKLSTLAPLGSTLSGQVSSVTFGSGGALYGTTYNGGDGGYGTVFKVSAGTDTVSTVVNFSGANGENPLGGLTVDAHGNLYGTTTSGGALGKGTVFEIAAGTDTFTTLASFRSPIATGSVPYGGVIVDAVGDLFGTTSEGGAGYGTVFEIAAGTNTINTLADFTSTDGSYPEAGLVADANGNLYGTTYGGSLGDPSVFELTGSGFVVPEHSGFVLASLCGVVLSRRSLRRRDERAFVR